MRYINFIVLFKAHIAVKVAQQAQAVISLEFSIQSIAFTIPNLLSDAPPGTVYSAISAGQKSDLPGTLHLNSRYQRA